MKAAAATRWALIESPVPALPQPLGEASIQRLQALLATRARRQLADGTSAASAVLAVLFERDADLHVWLLRRPEFMRSHAGQVAFPGGKQDAADPSLLHTALREAGEEVGLAASAVEVLGQLDDLVTGTGFVVTPYVAYLRGEFLPTPNYGEVARIFSVPLRAFTAPPSGTFPRVGVEVDGEFVWGATLLMLRHLCELMAAAHAG